MERIKIILIFTLIFIVGTLFSQNVTTAFKDPTLNTLNLVRQEDPTFPYPTPLDYERWMIQLYKSTDDVIDPLGPDGLPTGDDIISHPISPPDGILYLLFGPTGALNISGYTISPSTGYYDTQQGDKVYLRLFNARTLANATKYIVFNGLYTIPTTNNTPNINNAPINGWSNWIPIAPVTDTWTYNLAITASDNGAYEFTDPQGGVHTTPATLTDGPGDEANGLLGTYTVTSAPPAGFTWQSTTIEVVAGDFTAAKTDYVYNAAKQFVLVPIPDTYIYNLHIQGPEGYAVTGPTAELSGTIPYTKTSTVVTDLVGEYTVAAPPAGYQWVMNPITVTADMFQLVTTKNGGMNKVVLGSRTNGAKAHYVYEATITFVMEPIPVQYYNVLITSEPAGAAILVDNVDTGFVTPYTFTMEEGASATYTVQMANYTWTPTEFVVTNISENMSCNFVLTWYEDGNAITPPGVTIGSVITIQMTMGTAFFTTGTETPPVNTAWNMGYVQFLTLLGSGPWQITINTTYSFVWVVGVGVFTGPFPMTITIPATKDRDIEIQFGEGGDPTLPVELSYFAATLTAENFVNIAWTTQTETNMNGFNIYRNDGSDNLASANRIAYIPATNTSTTQNYNLIDREVEIGHTYYYWLECIEMNNHSTFNGPSPIYVNGPTPPVLPEYTKMHNAYPNPFRAGSGTTITVEVKKGDSGTVTIYNILGQVVKTFSLTEGTNNLNWNGRDSKGNLCGNGIYFYKLSTNSLNQTKKMVIVK